MVTHRPLAPHWEAAFDVVGIATVLLTVGRSIRDGGAGGPGWATAVLLVVGAGAVVLRRHRVHTAAGMALLTSTGSLLIPHETVPVWILAEICLFSVPVRGRRDAAIAFGLLHACLLYVGAMVAFHAHPLDVIALILPVWTAGVVALGFAVRYQDDYLEAVQQWAASAAAARAAGILHRTDTERLSIARDLHDSVSNALAVINLESSAAVRTLQSDPSRALHSLETIRTVTRSTVDELAGILAVLRNDPGNGDLTVSTAANIPHLVDLMGRSGLDVDIDLSGLEGLDLDPATDAALYRAAQECLTNAQRHGTGPVRLSVHATPSEVVLSADNQIGPRQSSGSGYGLIGLRERVALAGGRFEAGPSGDRFVTTTHLPLCRRPR